VSWLVEPGFWTNGPVHTALALGSVVAATTAIVGVGVVSRRQGFAGHALTDVAAAGGAGAALIGWPALAGFLGGSMLGAGAIEATADTRRRDRDLATGIVLGAALGLAALFFHLASVSTSGSGTTQEVLFGSLFLAPSSLVWEIGPLGVGAVGLLWIVHRPLLLVTASPDLARAAGVRVRLIGVLFAGVLAVATALAAVALGAILSTALVIGPAAAASRLCRRVGTSVTVSVGIALVATWLGILISYDSFEWTTSHRSVPVSATIVGLLALAYGASAVVARRRAT
jgi:zinc/manganese transport system permease protein